MHFRRELSWRPLSALTQSLRRTGYIKPHPVNVPFWRLILASALTREGQSRWFILHSRAAHAAGVYPSTYFAATPQERGTWTLAISEVSVSGPPKGHSGSIKFEVQYCSRSPPA